MKLRANGVKTKYHLSMDGLCLVCVFVCVCVCVFDTQDFSINAQTARLNCYCLLHDRRTMCCVGLMPR